MIDEKYYLNVADYQPVLLPRPTPKKENENFLEDGLLIPIITITCEGAEW